MCAIWLVFAMRPDVEGAFVHTEDLLALMRRHPQIEPPLFDLLANMPWLSRTATFGNRTGVKTMLWRTIRFCDPKSARDKFKFGDRRPAFRRENLVSAQVVAFEKGLIPPPVVREQVLRSQTR